MESQQQKNLRIIENLEEEYEQQLFAEIICKKCHFIIIDPILCKDCQTIYCTQCSAETCENCKSENLQMVPRMFTMLLDSIRFQECPFAINGCKTTQAKYSHIKECKYQKEIAEKCICNKCYLYVFEKDLETHQTQDCESAMVACETCGQMYQISMKEKHSRDQKCLAIQKERLIQQTTRQKAECNMIFVGDSGVGKTSILNAYVTGNLDTTPITATIDFDIQLKKVLVKDNIHIVAFWDIAGHQKFQQLNREYSYNNKKAVILTYDITRKETFENLKEWLNEIERYSQPKIENKILIGNKLDIDQIREVSHEMVSKFIIEHNIQYFQEVTAKNPITIIKCLDYYMQYLSSIDQLQQSHRSEEFKMVEDYNEIQDYITEVVSYSSNNLKWSNFKNEVTTGSDYGLKSSGSAKKLKHQRSIKYQLTNELEQQEVSCCGCKKPKRPRNKIKYNELGDEQKAKKCIVF